MKPGDLVRRKTYPDEIGLFIGMVTFSRSHVNGLAYTCAEVMWLNKTAPNGDRISTVQHDLIEVINESW